VPIDTEKNLVKTGGNPEAVFLQGMMGRAIANSSDVQIFLGYVEGTPYFAVDVTGKDVPLKDLGEFVDLRQVGPLLFASRGLAAGLCARHDLLAPPASNICGVCGATTKVTRGGHVRHVHQRATARREHLPADRPGGDHAGPRMAIKCAAGPRPAFPGAACIRRWRASSSRARASRTPWRASVYEEVAGASVKRRALPLVAALAVSRRR
jgi:NAD+ diphosphatase